MQILGYHLDLIRNSVGVLIRNSVAFVLTVHQVIMISLLENNRRQFFLRSLFVKNDKAVLSNMPKVQLVQKKNPFFNL